MNSPPQLGYSPQLEAAQKAVATKSGLAQTINVSKAMIS